MNGQMRPFLSFVQKLLGVPDAGKSAPGFSNHRGANKASISCAVLRAVRMTPISVAEVIPVQSP